MLACYCFATYGHNIPYLMSDAILNKSLSVYLSYYGSLYCRLASYPSEMFINNSSFFLIFNLFKFIRTYVIGQLLEEKNTLYKKNGERF